MTTDYLPNQQQMTVYQRPVYPQPWQPRYVPQPYSAAPPYPMQNMIRPVVRMVTSKDEAVTAQIEFDPSIINLFVDMAHGMIYSKRFNPNTGAADYADYALVIPAQPQQTVQPQQPPVQQQAQPPVQPQQQAVQPPVQPQQQPVMPEYVTVDAFHSLEGRVNEIGNAVAQWQSEQPVTPKKQPAKQAAKEE